MNGLTLLLYHGVTRHRSDGIQNYSGKHVQEDVFFAQMKKLREGCAVLSMDQVIEHYEKRIPFPSHAVAVTFDDGFQNNYRIAAPILSDLKIPATFYISTAMMGGSALFWVDAIEDCIRRAKHHKIQIQLDQGCQFTLVSISQKISAIEAIKNYCKKASDTEKERVLESLVSVTGVTPDVDASPDYRSMTWDEVRGLDSSPFFLIGGHSAEHRILASLSEELMQREIDRSILDLETHLKHPIIHYAYPEGQKHHYNDKVISHLKSRQIRCCPSAVDGVNFLEDDLFHLKRIMVGFKDREFPEI